MRFPRYLLVSFACAALASGALAQRSKSGLVGAIPTTTSAVESPEGTAGSAMGPKNLRPAPNALGWRSGTFVNTSDYDCLQFGGGFSFNAITGSFVSFYGDPSSIPPTPKVGDVYYTAVYVQDVAACQGVYVNPWLILPANTSLAISGTNPVYCYKNNIATTAGCGQSLNFGTSLSGASGYNLGTWPLTASGGSIEIQVPVSSSSTGVVTLYSRVDTADGWSNPSATPFVQYQIGANASSPTVGYPTPPTATLSTNTTARTTTNVFNQGLGGTLYFDIGLTSTTYDTSTAGNAIPASGNGYQAFADWSGLNPGTVYHWRGRFTYGAGSTALGADQTFTTTGTVTVPVAPTYVSAAPATPTQVTVTWFGVGGATSYQIWRRGPGSSTTYTNIGTSSTESYTDTTAAANSAYLYKVAAVNGAGTSPFSQSDLATTVIYSDDRLVEFNTVIKLAHLTQLRTAINAVRALANQGAGTFTDAAVPGLPVKAVHILELRTQFDSAMGVLFGTNSSWATTPVVGGKITFVEFQQLRDRLK